MIVIFFICTFISFHLFFMCFCVFLGFVSLVILKAFFLSGCIWALFSDFEADGVIELHVDDGHGCGKETVIAELLSFLSEKIEMTWVQGIKCGEEIDEHSEQETFAISVEKVGDGRLQRKCFSKIGQVVHRRRQ